MIKIENVEKKFGTVQVLKDVNLEINKGEIYGLIGLSGAGKSTLLRLINGIDTLTSGNILIRDGTKFGFVFQNFNLVNSLSAYENIELALLQEKLTKEEKHKKIIDVLKLTGLESYKDSYPKQLSGGQKQRVGIARALVMDINVLLCDEATSALDPITANEIINLLNDLNTNLGLTIIFVSHQLEIVKDFCDHIAILHKGEVKEIGTSLQVFSNPQSEIAISLLSQVLNTNKLAEIEDLMCVICYTDKEIKSSLKKIIEADLMLYGTYKYETKQGMFSHIYVEQTNLLNDCITRRINE